MAGTGERRVARCGGASGIRNSAHMRPEYPPTEFSGPPSAATIRKRSCSRTSRGISSHELGAKRPNGRADPTVCRLRRRPDCFITVVISNRWRSRGRRLRRKGRFQYRWTYGESSAPDRVPFWNGTKSAIGSSSAAQGASLPSIFIELCSAYGRRKREAPMS